MTIKHSKSSIAEDDHILISHGYAKDQITQIRLLFEYTDEQKKENLRILACDGENRDAYLREAYRKRGEYMQPIISRLAEEFRLYQFNPDDTIRYDSGDWDLFFWCNRLENTAASLYMKGNDYSYMTLDFNARHTDEEQLAVCNRLMKFVQREFADRQNLRVVFCHSTKVFNEKLSADIPNMISALDGLQFSLFGTDGRLVANGDSLYWMKKYAKKRGVKFDDCRIAKIFLGNRE